MLPKVESPDSRDPHPVPALQAESPPTYRLPRQVGSEDVFSTSERRQRSTFLSRSKRGRRKRKELTPGQQVHANSPQAH